MDFLKKLAKAVGAVVDTAVPVGVGNRTKYAVLGCTALQFGGPFVPAQYQPAVTLAHQVLCAGIPAFALAGAVR